MTESMDYTELLKEHDLKATPQRVIFLDELHKAGHLSIEELETRVKRVIPTISTATIYKNINSMVEKGLLNEVKLAGVKTKYEIKKSRHGHLFCESCKEIYDIEIDTECLSVQLDIGNDIRDIEVSVKGICPSCAKKSD